MVNIVGTYYTGNYLLDTCSTSVITTSANTTGYLWIDTGTSSTTISAVNGIRYYKGTGTYSTSIQVYEVQPYVPPKINYAKVKRETREARSIIKRGVRLFENLFGIGQIGMFLHGDGISIEGRRFNYRISRLSYKNIISHSKNPSSHAIPYRLEVCSKQGLVLFQGCTVFKNTPIVDQIIAIILSIRDNEERVLMNMTFFNFSKDFDLDSEAKAYVEYLKMYKRGGHGRIAAVS